MSSLILGGEILIMDGAMGTELIKRGLTQGQPSMIWNADRPSDVLSVHRSYADAGSDCITTNTFGGSTLMLDRYGLRDRFEELNRLAVHLAREAAEGRSFILGDIGPCGDFLEPLGDLTDAELADEVKRQADVLAEAGVDGFIVETMSDPNEMHVTVSAIKAIGLPIIGSYTYERTLDTRQTMMGTSPREASLVAIHAGADAIGANCGTSLSLEDYLAIGEELQTCSHGTPILLQPNAGTPVATADGYAYAVTPAEFAEWAIRAAALGVRIVGGCCGTTPEHIAAVAAAIKHPNGAL